MAGIFYVEITQSGRPSRNSHLSCSFSQETARRPDRTGDILHRQCPTSTVATCCELLFAAFCSLLCSSYVVRHEQPSLSQVGSVVQNGIIDTGYFALILDPPPALMLGACLTLGCSISSFAYRRQQEDRYQSLIFVLAITLATIFGFALGINANSIMLGLIPWALCVAMILSIAVHWLVRCRRDFYMQIHCCEIGERGVLPEKEVPPSKK